MTKSISEAVAQRAYELFLARGASHGFDLQDWLDAERELIGRGNIGASRSRLARRRTAPTGASGKSGRKR